MLLKQIFNQGRGGAIVDPGNAGTIAVDRSPVSVHLDSAGTETRTLAVPTRPGAIVGLVMRDDGGDITLTVTSGYNEAGDTTFTFSDPGQFVVFMSFEVADDTYRWRKVSDYGLGNVSATEFASLDGLTATAAEINARAAAASRLVVVTDAATYTVLAADSGKIHVFPDLTQSCTLALPAVAAGLEYTFIGKGVAADASHWIFQSASATNFFLGGVGFLDTDDPADSIVAVYSNGTSNDFLTVNAPGAGTRIHLVCDGTNWIANGIVIGATAPAFSDT